MQKEKLKLRLEQSSMPEPMSGCWLWLGYIDRLGYGRIKIRPNRSPQYVHRVSYEAFVDDIPHGLTIDHLCRVRSCINPFHLEPVTQGVNTLRGDTIPSYHAQKTHCKHGHEFSLTNTAVTRLSSGNLGRLCRTCRRIRSRNSYLRRRKGGAA